MFGKPDELKLLLDNAEAGLPAEVRQGLESSIISVRITDKARI